MQNGSRNVANARKGSDQARGVDGDDNEINVGFYPNELQPNSVDENPGMPVPMNEPEPDLEQERVIAENNVQDENILLQSDNTP